LSYAFPQFDLLKKKSKTHAIISKIQKTAYFMVFTQKIPDTTPGTQKKRLSFIRKPGIFFQHDWIRHPDRAPQWLHLM